MHMHMRRCAQAQVDGRVGPCIFRAFLCWNRQMAKESGIFT